MRLIPLHSLVILTGTTQNIRKTNLALFPKHEVLSAAEIRTGLIGNKLREGIDEAVVSEIHRRMIVKLKLGERVVIDDVAMSKQDRMAVVNIASRFGMPIFYLVCGENVSGDGIAEVIDGRKSDISPVLPMPNGDMLNTVRGKWSGITAIGDIHGMYQSMLTAIDWARTRNHFIVFAGDVIDYGPGTLEVADEVYRIVMRGQGLLVLGNHERKIMRWIDGQRVRLSDGNRVTTNALSNLSEMARQKWIGRFRGLYQNSRLIQSFGNVRFAHAALHPSVWNGAAGSKAIENQAFFGEVDDALSRQGRPVMTYNWVSSIPANNVVVVGHDIRSTDYPMLKTNERGGRALFLDTGSGKGGPLSSADFRFTDTGLKLGPYNIY